MDLHEAAWQLSDLLETNRAVFVRTEPEAPDFTDIAPFKILIFGLRGTLELTTDQKNIIEIISLFDATIFNKDRVDRLYFWNLKSLASYFYFHVKKHLKITNNIIDLKPIEGFLGIRKNRPENLVEAVDRAKKAILHKGWLNIYKAVHLPLSLRILPSIETTPLLNEEAKRPEYPYYEIEGQMSGRMNCMKKFSKSYLPHNMGPDVRRALKPRGYNLRFMCSDFRNCEVTVLQWLSNDPALKELLESKEDLYQQFYEIITSDKCDSDIKRKKAKAMLISVIYGSGAKRLGEILQVPEGVSGELIRRIHVKFPVACDWLDEQQKKAKVGVVLDYLGRPRVFEEPYLARNFVVQGVAATVCQEKMIELCGKLDSDKAYVAYSVHDGFGMVVKTDAAREAYKLTKEILEAPSNLCPGLKMKVEIKFGARLDKLKVLWRD